MIPCRYRSRRAWLCTVCGRLVRLSYKTGRLVEIWKAKRYGRKVS
jgi:hypothetical protein